jgi:hypothetical protein
MRPVGWRYESQRHSLAARGVHTSYAAVRVPIATPEETEDSIAGAMRSKAATADQLVAAKARMEELRKVVASEEMPASVKIGAETEIQEYRDDVRGLEEKQKQLEAFIRAKSGQTGFMAMRRLLG